MRSKIIKIIMTILALGVISSISAQENKYAGSFLELGVGARAMGMGGAFVSIADDGSAFYWNPAGVSQLIRPREYRQLQPLQPRPLQRPRPQWEER